MLSVSTALARLSDGLDESFPDSPGTRIIDIAFPLNDAFDPLLWCGQQRNGRSFTGSSVMAMRNWRRWGR